MASFNAALRPLFGVASDQYDHDDYVILRTKDRVNLRVSKSFLSSSSGLFRDMFQLPQPTNDSEDAEYLDGLPVIPMQDADASLLQNLLLFCISPPQTSRLNDIEGLARMYDMPEVELRILRAKVRDNISFVPSVMLDTIGQKIDDKSDQYVAAVSVILFPDDERPELLTPAQVEVLKAYHNDCIVAARDIASPRHNHYSWMADRWADANWFTGSHDACCDRGGNIFIGNTSGKWMTRRWWMAYIYASRAELDKKSCGSVVRQRRLLDQAMKEGLKCSRCSQGLDVLFWEFASLFAGRIDQAVSSVLLDYE